VLFSSTVSLTITKYNLLNPVKKDFLKPQITNESGSAMKNI